MLTSGIRVTLGTAKQPAGELIIYSTSLASPQETATHLCTVLNGQIEPAI
jgi:hypothetical protein